ncbi:MAG: MerR family DNA-binding transcriptional regulator [Rhodothalassiaceae bacterium]
MAVTASGIYTIADLAREFGVTHRTIRFYEDQGLISPERQGTRRLYSRADRARLAWILRAKRVGFSIAEISEMLDLYHLGDGRLAQRQVTLAKCQERMAALTQQRADIDKTLSELSAFCDLLETLIQDPKAEADARQTFRSAVGEAVSPPVNTEAPAS